MPLLAWASWGLTSTMYFATMASYDGFNHFFFFSVAYVFWSMDSLGLFPEMQVSLDK
jgi:hypothetical protein